VPGSAIIITYDIHSYFLTLQYLIGRKQERIYTKIPICFPRRKKSLLLYRDIREGRGSQEKKEVKKIMEKGRLGVGGYRITHTMVGLRLGSW